MRHLAAACKAHNDSPSVSQEKQDQKQGNNHPDDVQTFPPRPSSLPKFPCHEIIIIKLILFEMGRLVAGILRPAGLVAGATFGTGLRVTGGTSAPQLGHSSGDIAWMRNASFSPSAPPASAPPNPAWCASLHPPTPPDRHSRSRPAGAIAPHFDERFPKAGRRSLVIIREIIEAVHPAFLLGNRFSP